MAAALQNFIIMDAQSRLVLPRELRGEGKEKRVFQAKKKRDGTIELIPVVKMVTAKDPQAYFWMKRWQEGERQASEDLQNGRMSDVKTKKELKSFFESLKK